MQIISILGTASGKAGGVVATRGRAGAQLRARPKPAQPRTPAQTNARALTGSLPAAWRSLTFAQRAAWAALATTVTAKDRLGQAHPYSGYTLFIKLSRQLASIGLYPPNPTPQPTPAFPPTQFLSATALYAGSSPGIYLSGFAIFADNADATTLIPTLSATAALSQAKANIRASDLKVIAQSWPVITDPGSALTAWLARFGALAPPSVITFQLVLTDPVTGWTSTPLLVTTPLILYAPQPTIPGLLTIQVETTTVAQTPNTYIKVSGSTVAQ